VSRIIDSSLRVDHVLVDVDLPPSGSEIDRNIVGDVEVTVQLEDSSERSVEGVVESGRIVSGVTFGSHEHLRVGWGRSDGFLEGPVALEGSSTSPDVERTESISSRNLSRDVEIFLPEPLSASSSRVGPISGEGDVD